MASVADLIAQTQAAIAVVEQQMEDIAGFELVTDNTITLVRTALSGSTSEHDVQMLASLEGASRSLAIAKGALMRASEALVRVQQI